MKEQRAPCKVIAKARAPTHFIIMLSKFFMMLRLKLLHILEVKAGLRECWALIKHKMMMEFHPYITFYIFIKRTRGILKSEEEDDVYDVFYNMNELCVLL